MKLLARIFGKAMLKKSFLFNSTWEIPYKKKTLTFPVVCTSLRSLTHKLTRTTIGTHVRLKFVTSCLFFQFSFLVASKWMFVQP